MILQQDLPLRFDHVGIVVPSLAAGREHLTHLFSIRHWTVEFDDPGIGVRVQFGRDESGVCYETIAPLGNASPIAQALRSGQRILNHVAYLTPDIAAAAAFYREQGCAVVGDAVAAVAYQGRKVQFFISPLRFMFELIEARDHSHDFHGE